MKNRMLWAGLLALAVSCPARAASLTLLPDWFVAPTMRDLFMLPDGKTFTGVDGTDVFRWSPSEGRTDLGVIPDTTGALDLPIFCDRRLGRWQHHHWVRRSPVPSSGRLHVELRKRHGHHAQFTR